MKALTISEAQEVTTIAASEGILIESAALALFAAVTDRFPRDLLTVLDALHIAAPDGITVELVKDRLSL